MLQTVGALVEGRKLESVGDETTVQEALSIMVEKDYTQLPVVHAEDDMFTPLVGLFTQRRLMSLIDAGAVALSSVLLRPVSEFMETSPTVVSPERSIYDVAKLLSQPDIIAVLVAPNFDPMGFVNAVGIVTDYDISTFLVRWSEGIALIEAIESYLRQCIEYVLSSPEKRQAMLCRVFGIDKTDSSKPAKAYDELTLWEHQQLITDAKSWSQFEPFLGPKELFVGFMQSVRPIRNQVAHFRGELTERQRRRLKDARDWLALRARAWNPEESIGVFSEPRHDPPGQDQPQLVEDVPF